MRLARNLCSSILPGETPRERLHNQRATPTPLNIISDAPTSRHLRAHTRCLREYIAVPLLHKRTHFVFHSHNHKLDAQFQILHSNFIHPQTLFSNHYFILKLQLYYCTLHSFNYFYFIKKNLNSYTYSFILTNVPYTNIY